MAYRFYVQKTLVLGLALRPGAQRRLLQVGIGFVCVKGRLRLIFIKRKLVQTRIQ